MTEAFLEAFNKPFRELTLADIGAIGTYMQRLGPNATLMDICATHKTVSLLSRYTSSEEEEFEEEEKEKEEEYTEEDDDEEEEFIEEDVWESVYEPSPALVRRFTDSRGIPSPFPGPSGSRQYRVVPEREGRYVKGAQVVISDYYFPQEVIDEVDQYNFASTVEGGVQSRKQFVVGNRALETVKKILQHYGYTERK